MIYSSEFRAFPGLGGPSKNEEKRVPARPMDPELLYVECERCGRPILWERGRTTEVLEQAGVDFSGVDENCYISSAGCPRCMPEELVYETRLVRLNGMIGLDNLSRMVGRGNA